MNDDWLFGSPVRSEPSEFDRVATAYENRLADVFAATSDMRELFDSYGSTHSGSNITTIVSQGKVVAESLQSLLSGYGSLMWGFRSCANGLRALEAEVHETGGLNDLREEFNSAGSGSGDAGGGSGRAGKAEYDRLQAEEKKLLKELSGKIEGAPTGDLADLDNGGLKKILDIILPNIEDVEIREGLVMANHLLAVEGVADDEPGGSLDRDLFVDDVADAMQEGIDPEDTDFADFFPPDYAELHELERRSIPGFEADRENADGASYKWWDNDDAALEQADIDLKEARERRDELRERLGADGDGKLSEVEAVGAVADHTGDRKWEGRQYAEKIGERPDLSNDDLEVISTQVAEEPETSVSFFNDLGPEEAASLPAIVYANHNVGWGKDQEQHDRTLESFSVALGEATRHSGDGKEDRLSFSGAELIRQGQEADGIRFIDLPTPESLFITGEFDQDFLVEATAESLRKEKQIAIDDDPGLEDPRNIMLDRAAEDPSTAAAVVANLDKSGDVEVLLSPDEPFPVTSEDSTHPSGKDYPITKFLNIAGADDDAARTILIESAEDPEPFSDPGVAGGVDDIMARHATIMYEQKHLDAIGVEKTNLDGSIEDKQWQDIHAKVLDHGEGRRLQAKTEEFYLESVAVAVDDGVIDKELVEPFGVVYGAVKTETDEAAVAYYADLDDEARKKNERAALASSLAFSALPIDDDTVAWGVWGIEEGLGLTKPFEVPTDQELEELRNQRDQGVAVDQHRSTLLKNVVYQRQIEKAAEEGTIEINLDGETREVPIVQRDDGTYRIRFDNGQGEFVEHKLPPRGIGDEYDERFAGTDVDKNVNLAPNANDPYLDGVIASIDDEADLIERRAKANIDQGIEGTPEQNSAQAVDDAKGRAGEHGVPLLVADGPEPKEDDGWWPF